MTIEEIKAAIQKTEKRIESPILDDSAKKALKEKLKNLKSELEKLESKADDTVKEVSKKTKTAKEKVKKVAKEVESKVKRGSEEIKSDIEKLEKKLKNPIINESAKESIREKLETVKKELSDTEDKKPKTSKKSSVKSVEDKPEKKSKDSAPVKKQDKKAVAKKEDSKTVTINGKTLSTEDCTEILKEYSTARKKAKKSIKKSRSRSTATRVAANVAHAIETAIKSVPPEEISLHPLRETGKFRRLKETGEEFLKAFKSVIGDEYNTVDIKKEFDDVDKLINNLYKKHK